MSEKQRSVRCQCGQIVKPKKGIFGWKDHKCVCGRIIDPNDTCYSDIMCACGERVPYNAKAEHNICPKCRRDLSVPEKQPEMEKIRVSCPSCGASSSYDKDALKVVCVVCGGEFDPRKEAAKKEAIHADTGTEIRLPQNLPEDWLVYRVKRDEFPIDAHVFGAPGCDAFIVQGSKCVQKICGSSVTLRDVPELERAAYVPSGSTGGRMVGVNVFYVKRSLNIKIWWANSGQVRETEGLSVKQLFLAGHSMVDIADTAQFLAWNNYTECSRKDFAAPDGPLSRVEPGAKAQMIHDMMLMCFQSAVDMCRAEHGSSYPLSQLEHHADDLTQSIQEAFNTKLAPTGMRVTTTVIIDNTIKAITSADHVECNLKWSSRFNLHEKDQHNMTADLTICGAGNLRVKDMERFLKTTEGARYMDVNADRSLPKREISDQIGRVLENQYRELLQGMVDSTGTTLIETPYFFNFVDRTTGELLNVEDGLLDRIGLKIENVTVRLDSFLPSELLKMKMEHSKAEDRVQIEAKMRNLANKVILDRYAEEKQLRIALRELEMEESRNDMGIDDQLAPNPSDDQLRTCPECGHKISRFAFYCPKCSKRLK